MASPLFEEEVHNVQLQIDGSKSILSDVAILLSLYDKLAEDTPFEQYAEIQSKLMSFFGVIKSILAYKYSRDELEEGLDAALSYEKLVPRLYVAYAIACSLASSEHLNLVISMFGSVGHPLRAFMLRFTAISFYPASDANLVLFAEQNFIEMQMLSPSVIELFPASEDAVCGWLTANVSIGVTSSGQDPHTIINYINSAINYQYQENMAVSIVSAVVQSLSSEKVVASVPALLKFFNEMPVNDSLAKLASFCCQKIGNLSKSFDFITQTKLAKTLSNKMFQMAVDSKDKDVLKRMLEKWPTDHFLSTVLKTLGSETFIEVAPVLTHVHTKIIIVCITSLERVEDIASVKRIVSGIAEVHDHELESALLSMFMTLDLGAEEIKLICSEPFHFTTNELFTYVMNIMKQRQQPLSALTGLYDRAMAIDQKVRIETLCSLWTPTDTYEDFMKCFSGNTLDEDVILSVLSTFGNVSPTTEILEEFLKRCYSRNGLFVFLDYLKRVNASDDIMNKAIIKSLSLDVGMFEMSSIANLYIDTLAFISELAVPFDSNILSDIVENVTLIFGASMPFRLAPPVELEQWKDRVTRLVSSDSLRDFADKIQKIIQLLDNAICK